MDFHELVSAGVDSKLKCFVCQNYLSYFPISLCSNNQSICGRCDVPEATIAFRDEAFESLSQMIKFPCRYNSEGCPETLVPRDIPNHEERCLYRAVPCVISKPQECEWKGCLPNLTKHCQDAHSDAILKNGEFTFDLSASDECDNLVEYNDGFYVFTRKFSASNMTLSCALYDHKKSLVTSARVCLKNGKRTLSLDLETSTEDIIYSDLGLHSLVGNNEAESSIVGHVDFNFDNQQLDEKTNSVLLSIIHCSKCGQFATTISDDDSRCTKCRRLVPDTTVFLQDFLKTMNLVRYPCKYHQFGCTFTDTHRTSHELVCQYQTENCPLHDFGSCSWTGLRKDKRDHILKQHPSLVVSSGVSLCAPEQETKCYFISYCDRLFHLVCEYYEYFKCAVQSVDCQENKFMYQIQIIDATRNGRKLLMRRECSNSTGLIDEFEDFSLCCYFEGDQLEHFRIELQPVLQFSVHIVAS